MHHLVTERIKYYLLRGFIIDLNFFNEIDDLIYLLGETTHCTSCNYKLTNKWKVCCTCLVNIVCKHCLECDKCNVFYDIIY